MSDKNFKVKNGLDANGAVTITQPNTSTVPLTILANTLATGSDLFQVKRPDGTVRLSIGNDGALSSQNLTAYNVTFYSAQAGSIPLVLRGLPSQTGDLQQWRDISETVLTKVDYAGSIYNTGLVELGRTKTSDGASALNFITVGSYSGAGGQATINRGSGYNGNFVLTNYGNGSIILNQGGTNILTVTNTGAATFSSDLTVTGNFTVNGTTTNLNSTNLVVEDKNIIIADVASPTDTTADGAGITIKGATDKTFNWVQSSGYFTSSENIEISKTNAKLKINSTGSSYTSGIDFIVSYPSYPNVTSKIFFDFYGDTGTATISGGGNQGIHYVSGRSSFGNHWFRKSTTDGVQMAILDAGNVGINNTAPTSTLHVNNLNASTVGLIVKGVSSQSANLQEWQNSIGQIRAKIDSYGGFSSLATTQIGNDLNGNGTALVVYTKDAAGIPIVIKGWTSQTANLQEWQDNSGNILANITSSGIGGFAAIRAAGGSINRIYFNSVTESVRVEPANSSYIGLVVKGVASQTTDLQQWQNSSGTVLSNIDKSGYFRGPLVEVTPTNPGLYGLAIFANASQTGDLFQVADSANNAYTGVSSTGKLVTGNTTNISRFTQITSAAIGQLTVYSTTSSTIGTVTRGAVSQTANLAEWQNNSGTILGSIGSGGVFTLYPTTSNQSSFIVKTDQAWVNAVDPNYSNISLLQNQINANVALGNIGGRISFGQRFWNGSSSLYNTGMIGSIKTSGDGGYDGGLTFHTTQYISGIGPNLYERMRIDGVGTTTLTPTAAAQGLIIKGAASQTANLQEWQNSSGSVLAYVDAYGTLLSNWKAYIQSGASYLTPLVVKAAASQTANLQEWQNSSGEAELSFNNASNPNKLIFTTSKGLAIYWGNESILSTSSGSLTASPWAADRVGLIVKGYGSQTANIQEWKNNSSSVLASISSDGTSTFGSMYITNGTHKMYGPFQILNNSTGSSTLEILAFGTANNAALNVGTKSTGDANNRYWTISTGGGSYAGQSGNWIGEGGLIFIENNPNDSSSIIRGGFRRGGQFSINSLGETYSAALSVRPLSTSTTGIVIRANAAQTGNLQEWQSSGGTSIAKVDSYGNVASVGLVITPSLATFTNATAQIKGTSPSNSVLALQPNSGSSTGDAITYYNAAGSAVLAKLDYAGNFSAVSKSFDIPHPTKENMRLRYASLEGPENGVYIRGTVESNIIELPEYWTGLVHEDSITVSLTAVGSAQNIYVEKIEDNKVYIGGELTKAFFTVYGERKDIDKLTVEY